MLRSSGLGGRGHWLGHVRWGEGKVNQDASMEVRITGSLCWSGSFLAQQCSIDQFHRSLRIGDFDD